MIHFDITLNLYQFDQPHHNIYKSHTGALTYNQLFVDDKLYVLNTKTGKIYTNTVELDKINLLKQYNFCADNEGRFNTGKNGQIVYIHELVYEVKTNRNYVINHIDGDPSNNILSNLELCTHWFNTVLMKKKSGLSIGIRYNNSGTSYLTKIAMPRIHGKCINFGAKELNYLQNIHYQFGTKSGLVTPKRYLKETPNWLPDHTIQFSPKHQIKLDQLIEAHLENQASWEQPIMLPEGSRMPYTA
jgi:hypothetical protein